MTSLVVSVVEQLRGAHGASVPLDALGDACILLSNEQVEEVVAMLERAGVTIEHETASGASILMKIVPAARALRTELGRKPTVAELAARADVTTSHAMRGLLYIRVLSR